VGVGKGDDRSASRAQNIEMRQYGFARLLRIEVLNEANAKKRRLCCAPSRVQAHSSHEDEQRPYHLRDSPAAKAVVIGVHHVVPGAADFGKDPVEEATVGAPDLEDGDADSGADGEPWRLIAFSSTDVV